MATIRDFSAIIRNVRRPLELAESRQLLVFFFDPAFVAGHLLKELKAKFESGRS